ncbi:hypothetical protein U3C50_001552 [Providencia rettgeri]|nr:hypothetical protein [Providencia rettgeri]
MRIEVMSITEPDPSEYSENDFKKTLNSANGKSKSEKKSRVNSIKSMGRKKNRKEKRGELPSSIILSILFSSFANEKKRNDNGNNLQKKNIKKISLEDASNLPVNGVFFHLKEISGGYQNTIDNNKKINWTENNFNYQSLLKTQDQYISQPRSLMNLNYCSDKKNAAIKFILKVSVTTLA